MSGFLSVEPISKLLKLKINLQTIWCRPLGLPGREATLLMWLRHRCELPGRAEREMRTSAKLYSLQQISGALRELNSVRKRSSYAIAAQEYIVKNVREAHN